MKETPVIGKAARLSREVERAQMGAARKIRNVFRAPGDELRNPDADVKWSECSSGTRIALDLVKQTMTTERTREMAAAPAAFGMLLVPVRMSGAQDWEKFAAEQAKPKMIDVEAKPVAVKE